MQFGHFTVSEMVKNDHFWPKWPKFALFGAIFDHFRFKKVQKSKRRVKAGLRHQTNDLLAYFGDMNNAKGGGRSRAEQNRFFQNWWFS